MAAYEKQYVHCILMLCIFWSHGINSTVLIQGSAGVDATQTFTIPIGVTATTQIPFNWFLGASQSGAGAYALNLLAYNSSIIVPLAPQNVILNNSKTEQLNPIFNSSIKLLDVMEFDYSGQTQGRQYPVCILTDQPTRAYIVTSFSYNPEENSTNVTLLATNDLPDATGAPTGNITQLSSAGNSGDPQNMSILTTIFAVTPSGSSTFGEPGSGLVAGFMVVTANQTQFVVVDGLVGVATINGPIRALPFDITSPYVGIGSPVITMNVSTIIWDPRLQLFFIGLQTQSGGGGARSVVVGKIIPVSSQPNSIAPGQRGILLYIYGIVPPAAVSGTNQIIATSISDTSVSANLLNILHSSTGLPYLIVQGDIGAPTATTQMVYALPLVSTNSATGIAGTIAQKEQMVQNYYTSIHLWSSRAFVNTALTSADMPLATDKATQVGGGPLPYGPISDMFTQSDAVFVTVQNPTAGYQGGIFSSQALFDPTGKIIGWTNWQRVAGTQTNIAQAFLEANIPQYVWLEQNITGSLTTVKRTTWDVGDAQGFAPIQNAAAQTFFPQDGGVHGVANFSSLTPGLNNISLLTFFGRTSIMLVQTSIVSGGIETILGGTAYADNIIFTNGTITQTFPIGTTRVISITGGELTTIGPVLKAAIASNGTGGWLLVGGVHGAAILSQSDGSGWNTATGLGDFLIGLSDGMSFKPFGNYTAVRNLYTDGAYLYVLTATQLDRIALTDPQFGLGTPTAVTIARTTSLPGVGTYGSFFDVIISEKIALLGTSNGLWRLANNLDIRTVSTDSPTNWTYIPTLFGVGATTQLVPITTTGQPTSIAQGVGGNLYVMNVNRSQNHGRIFRYTIAPTDDFSITDTTVTPFNDIFTENRAPTYFVNLSQFKSLFMTDGALFLHDHDKNGEQQFAFRSIPYGAKYYPQTGIRFLGVLSKIVPLLEAAPVRMTGLLRIIPAGSYVTCGDYGIRINE